MAAGMLGDERSGGQQGLQRMQQAGMLGQDRAVGAMTTAGARPTPIGPLQDAVTAGTMNADRVEEMANELQRVVANYLGSEPEPGVSEDAQPEEPCLHGSLLNSNRRIRNALDRFGHSIDRLSGAWSV